MASLSCVAHSTPLASPEWERDGGAEAAVRTESEAAHWLPCAPGFHALAALALHRGRLFRGRSLSFKRCLRESASWPFLATLFCAPCKHFFRPLSFLPLPKPKRLPSHPTSRWGGEEKVKKSLFGGYERLDEFSRDQQGLVPSTKYQKSKMALPRGRSLRSALASADFQSNSGYGSVRVLAGPPFSAPFRFVGWSGQV